MAPSDIAKADIKELVEKLNLQEAVDLIAGVGFWHTAPVERLGIPAIKVSLFLALNAQKLIRVIRSATVQMVRTIRLKA